MGGFAPSPLLRYSPALEVEGHASGGRLDGRAADRVIGRVTRANLVTVTARTEAVMRAHSLSKYSADNIPACPLVEVVAGADRILVGGVVELIRLELAWLPIRSELDKISRGRARYAGIRVVETQAG